MHSCLTLIDYTWSEIDDAEYVSDISKNALLRRRVTTSECCLHCANTVDSFDLRMPSDRVCKQPLQRIDRKSLIQSIKRSCTRRMCASSDQYIKRQAPNYASQLRMQRPEFAYVWYPFVHCKYRLHRNANSGIIQWNYDINNIHCTPRTLTEICVAYIVRDWPCRISSQNRYISIIENNKQKPKHDKFSTSKDVWHRQQDYDHLPVKMFDLLLTEAIIQRDCSAISGLISNWPKTCLNILDLLPKEDFPFVQGYLTAPTLTTANFDNSDLLTIGISKSPSILDAFIIGLLSRQPSCKLQSLDFSGFEDDRRVSMELTRLPLLWMRPETRNSDRLRQQIRTSLQVSISDQTFNRYFNRISSIYKFHEAEFYHEQMFDAMNICLDCNMSIDEVAFGLALQNLTPFRFSCNRLLMQSFPELPLPVFNLISLLDPMTITQFELERAELSSNQTGTLSSALGWITSLRNLRACALLACILPPRISVGIETFCAKRSLVHPGEACRLLNRSLISLRHLQRLSLTRCYLTGQLSVLLGGLSQPLEYLNLQDCCLCVNDINFLVLQWRPLRNLYELNIARNNLSDVPESTLASLLLQTCFNNTGRLTCLSLAYTCLSFERLVWILKLLAQEIDLPVGICTEAYKTAMLSGELSCDCGSAESTLRVLCLQHFIPPNFETTHKLLNSAVCLRKLRLLHIYPSFYAFPGSNELEQQTNRAAIIGQSSAYVRQRGCSQIEIR